MGERDSGELRYTAFLSYSHMDAAAAGRLHRKLEAYRLPRRLVGTETARCPVPERLAPIFRDREELPAATDLSETVREALAGSGALIILCSPHSAGSLWVAEEIETFRRLHPDRPILAAILDGDPPDCFPKALRAFGHDGTWHEPLATDLRRGRDGAHLGLLKLVAGITGVGLDALVQRDAQRKIRRVTAVTGAAILALLIMTALAVAALQARREADRQRDEVGRQIEFMITDLRQRLQEVGRLDILYVVNQHALDYYQQQRLDSLSPESLERRARVLHVMGIDDLARGRLALARLAFDDAYRTTAEQLARAPNDPRRIYAHAQSEYYVGEVHARRRQWTEALRYFSRYAEAAERLVAIAPNNPDYMMEMGYAASNIGTVQLHGLEDPVAAQAAFGKALRWFRQVERVRPGDWTARRKQANAYANLADTFYARQLWREALAARRRQHDIYFPLWLASHGDMQLLYEVALSERAVGRQLSILREQDAARPYLLKAYQHARALRRHDPRNADWLVLKAKIECDLLHGLPSSPPDRYAAQLRGEINAAVTQLAVQNNPRVSEISSCREQSEPRQPVRQQGERQ